MPEEKLTKNNSDFAHIRIASENPFKFSSELGKNGPMVPYRGQSDLVLTDRGQSGPVVPDKGQSCPVVPCQGQSGQHSNSSVHLGQKPNNWSSAEF